MWFVFGFITLISFSTYWGIKRYKASWKGTPAHSYEEGISYECAYTFQKNDRIPSFKVAVSAPGEFDFAFKRESWYDRVCKFLGLSVEYQVGSAEFDRLVYIVSNDGHLAKQLQTQEAMRDGVMALFKLDLYTCVVTEICCSKGRLWAVVKVGKQFRHKSDWKYLTKVEQSTAALLYQLAVTLKAVRPQEAATERDPFVLRAAIVLACSTGLMVNGMAHAARLFLLTDALTLDTGPLWLYAAYGAGLSVAGLLLLALFMLGRSARAHLVLIELVLVGGIGALLTLFTELRDLNMEADKSPTAFVQAKIIDKTMSRSRKGGTRYYVQVPDWIEPGEVRKIHVSSDFYAAADAGKSISFEQRAGFLGIRWVQSYALVTSK